MKTRRLLILFAVALISFGASGCGYNTLTTKHEHVKGQWANTETQLQRRADLLNNLTEAAKMACRRRFSSSSVRGIPFGMNSSLKATTGRLYCIPTIGRLSSPTLVGFFIRHNKKPPWL